MIHMVTRLWGLNTMIWQSGWVRLLLVIACALAAPLFGPSATLYASPAPAPAWHLLAQESPLVSPLATPIITPDSLPAAAQASPVSLMLVGVVLVGVLLVVAVVVWRQR